MVFIHPWLCEWETNKVAWTEPNNTISAKQQQGVFMFMYNEVVVCLVKVNMAFVVCACMRVTECIENVR